MREGLSLAAAEFVFALPQGLDTTVGDRGMLLSHGQRQRIALARALLRKPGLLILDEATSSLDLDNEKRILDAIEHLQGRTTVLLIAHRVSAIQRAQMIYVIDNGSVAEWGDWQSLSRGLPVALARSSGCTIVLAWKRLFRLSPAADRRNQLVGFPRTPQVPGLVRNDLRVAQDRVHDAPRLLHIILARKPGLVSSHGVAQQLLVGQQIVFPAFLVGDQLDGASRATGRRRF